VVASNSNPWETWGMADQRIPKKGDHVLTTEYSGTFIVFAVHEKHGTANVKPLGRPGVIWNVEWKTLSFLNKEDFS